MVLNWSQAEVARYANNPAQQKIHRSSPTNRTTGKNCAGIVLNWFGWLPLYSSSLAWLLNPMGYTYFIKFFYGASTVHTVVRCESSTDRTRYGEKYARSHDQKQFRMIGNRWRGQAFTSVLSGLKPLPHLSSAQGGRSSSSQVRRFIIPPTGCCSFILECRCDNLPPLSLCDVGCFMFLLLDIGWF